MVVLNKLNPFKKAPTDAEQKPKVKMTNKKLISCMLLVFVSMGGFMVGFDTGIIGGLENMPDFQKRFANRHNKTTGAYSYSPVRNGLIVAIVNIGTLIGSLLSMLITDRIGKRKSIIMWCVLYLIGNCVQVSIQRHWYQLTVGRILVGIAMGGHSVVVPGYQAECAPQDVRGAIVATYHVSNAGGSLLASLVNLGCHKLQGPKSWRIPFGLNFVWCMLLLVGMIFLPESPRFLMMQDRPDECIKVLANLNGVSIDDPSIELEFLQIEDGAVKDRMAGTSRWKELLEPSILYRTALGFAIMCLQQLSGVNYFMFYSSTIFNGIGVGDKFVASIIITAVNFGGCMVAPWLIEGFGRRPPLIVGGIFNFMCLIVYSTVGYKKLYPDGDSGLIIDSPVNRTAGIVMIVFTCLFICSFGLSWAPTAWVIVGESYPQRFRSKCAAIATAGFWVSNFLVGFFTAFISQDIGYKYGYIFAGCSLSGAVVVYVFAKETKGLVLEDISLLYESNVKPWNSGKWAKARIEEGKKVGREIENSGMGADETKAVVDQFEHQPPPEEPATRTVNLA